MNVEFHSDYRLRVHITDADTDRWEVPLVVYPAAGLVNYAARHIPKYILDKKIPYTSPMPNLFMIEQAASTGISELVSRIRDL